MSVTQLLDQLDGIRSIGPNRWIARCPAHDDRRPSLTIREMDDGMALVHCWSGCEFSEIVRAVGLKPSDLFPPKPLPVGEYRQKGHRKPFPAADILAAVANKALIAATAVRDVANGRSLSDVDIARLLTASGRLLEAARCAHV
jgi:hypothetical protein